MALHYSNGVGRLYDKEIEKPVATVKYQLIETDPTKYTKKKWWGDFSTNREIKRLGNYIIELEDRRKGECIISPNTEVKKGRSSRYYYHLNGRGKLGAGKYHL